MAKRITTDDIREINELYIIHKSYAEVARRTGWSASTVSKYVDKNYTPAAKLIIKKFDLQKDLPSFSTDIFHTVEDIGELCVYTEDEKVELFELWEELSI